MSAKHLRFCGTVSNRGEAAGQLKESGDAVLIERGRPRLLLLSCPCGCGEEFPINLDSRVGPAWRLYRNARTGMSLFPSVWRESGCRSHYIIWRNAILLFGRNDEEFDDTSPAADELDVLTKVVEDRLPAAGLVPFSELAEAVDAVPWDVLVVCRRLVRLGRVYEGTGKQRGEFGRV